MKLHDSDLLQSLSNQATDVNQSRRNSLKVLLAGGLGLAATSVHADTGIKNDTCMAHDYNAAVDSLGEHQAGVITPDPKEAIFIAFKLTVKDASQLQNLFQTLSTCIAYLTSPQRLSSQKDDRLPPPESGFLGNAIEPDSLTVTVSLGDSFFDERFGLSAKKPKHLITMERFPNDQLQPQWVGGDVVLQLCANSKESVVYALRDLVRHTQKYMIPIWKIDGFLPSRDIDRKSTAINLFGFKDGTGNGDIYDKALMDELVWVTDANMGEPAWCIGGSYQAIRLIRFNLEFWDRTPLEDQENNFGRVKSSGAPMGRKNEMDDPGMEEDPHGDRILFDSHMRRAEPRVPERHIAKLRRRSFSYSLGLTPSGSMDMGLIFVAYQNDLLRGFIQTQARLNGEPLERYITPYGGGYYFVLPGMQDNGDYLGKQLLKS